LVYSGLIRDLGSFYAYVGMLVLVLVLFLCLESLLTFLINAISRLPDHRDISSPNINYWPKLHSSFGLQCQDSSSIKCQWTFAVCYCRTARRQATPHV